MFDITALGEILIDFTPGKTVDNQSGVFVRNAGGAPANVLAAMAKFGAGTAFIGSVGKDMFGDFLIATLKENGIRTDGVVVDEEHNTTLAFVSLDESGDRDFSFYRRFGADVFLRKEDINATLIQNSRIFHFGSLSLTDEPAKSATHYALSLAKEAGCTVTFDPNWRELLWESPQAFLTEVKNCLPMVDVLKVSAEEAAMLTGKDDKLESAELLLKEGPSIVLITDGGNGVTYAAKGISGHLPSLDVAVKDTTGAGDIFFGTFLYTLIRQTDLRLAVTREELEHCVSKAIRISGISTTQYGAIASIPDYNA